ncbi:hypothetical protein M9Y10_024381 [Tritrichomonas musculus]|uniref:F5/8 type C domain-containing protein n=1 Tax=Tritrichomonas musculus TaxID=1915356 RepID=A0ABR2HCT9_9EUKA
MNGGPDAFICFDFKKMAVQLSDYTMQSNNCIGENWFNLRNWAIEVSDDNQNWVEIDRHVDDPALNGRNIVHTFSVKNQESGFHRFVRLRQTGRTWNQPEDINHFFFPYIEFYGKLKKKD